jgi:hypothetical protein
MGARPVPSEFFIFVNQASFWTRHNFNVSGSFVSGGFAAANPDAVPSGTVAAISAGAEAPVGSALRAGYEAGTLDYLQFSVNPQYFGWPTPFAAGATTEYRVEWDAEVCRKHYDPMLPSRLSAVFAFGDYAACEAVNAQHGWPLDEVEQFRLIPNDLNRLTRVNMEIVSVARCSYRRAFWESEQIDWFWRSYWSGAGNLAVELPIDGVNFERVESGEIWEYLIEGRLDSIG